MVLKNVLFKKMKFVLYCFSPVWVLLSIFSMKEFSPDIGKNMIVFYDRNGEEITPEKVRAISNNGNGENDNDVLMNPKTMQVLKMKPLYILNNRFFFDTDTDGVAFALNWPTETLGYGILILDNLGNGFKASTTINFTYQAALDYKNKLDKALEKRTAYVKSAKFQNYYESASKHINAAKASTFESAKGKEGQLALDKLALAYDLLLYEYGPQFAGKHQDTQAPMLAVTIDRVDGYKENLDTLAKVAAPYAWIRIVFNKGEIPSTYRDLVEYASLKGIKILGQPVDSFYDKEYNLEQYLKRFKEYVVAFPQIDTWEIANEVNGRWLSSSIAKKIDGTATYLKSVNKKTVLTTFYQLNTDTMEYALFNWIDKNIPQPVRKKIDMITLSQYQEQAPVGMSFDQTYSTLKSYFPNSEIAIGELGYWIEGQSYWWAYDKLNPLTMGRQKVCDQYYRASLGYEKSLGACFWWTYCEDMHKDAALLEKISSLRDILLLSKIKS